MPETVPIKPADLLIDEQNPRISQPNAGQNKAQQALAHHQQMKLQRLAKDIVKHGVNPSELPIVMPLGDDLNRYIVLEGNRRLAALKALENPEALAGAVKSGVLAEMRKLSRQYHDNPIEEIQCLVVEDREEARHWIELKHTGENEGAGIVRWGSDESARFRARAGGLEIHQQALNFLEQRGDLTPETRRRVPTTNFKRLIETPDVRSKLGVEVQEGRLCLLADSKNVAKAMLYVINDLTSGNKKVHDIYTKSKRVQYANELPSEIVVTPIVKSGHGMDVSTGVISTPKPTKAPLAKNSKPRDRLIPRDCILHITDPRIAEIAGELRRLKFDGSRNAISVLFRVFVELSVDSYIERRHLATVVSAKLKTKLQDVARDLVKQNKLTSQQVKPVNKAWSSSGLLAPSVNLMHEYVHNQYIFPESADLRAHWNSLQPFIVAMWAP